MNTVCEFLRPPPVEGAADADLARLHLGVLLHFDR